MFFQTVPDHRKKGKVSKKIIWGFNASKIKPDKGMQILSMCIYVSAYLICLSLPNSHEHMYKTLDKNITNSKSAVYWNSRTPYDQVGFIPGKQGMINFRKY